MRDFIAASDRALLQRHGLADFEALWALNLPAVDEPNTGRGGWSGVYRLQLDDTAYYLKRQRDYLVRGLRSPLGEPTLTREMRNIRRYSKRGIPTLQPVLFGERKEAGKWRALLMTRALDGWQDLDHWLGQWPGLPGPRRQAIIEACAPLARRLHGHGQMHACFYPKHIFLRPRDHAFETCLIDLEKARPLLFGNRDRIRDIDPLIRRARAWDEADLRCFLAAYLAPGEDIERWRRHLGRHKHDKEARG